MDSRPNDIFIETIDKLPFIWYINAPNIPEEKKIKGLVLHKITREDNFHINFHILQKIYDWKGDDYFQWGEYENSLLSNIIHKRGTNQYQNLKTFLDALRHEVKNGRITEDERLAYINHKIEIKGASTTSGIQYSIIRPIVFDLFNRNNIPTGQLIKLLEENGFDLKNSKEIYVNKDGTFDYGKNLLHYVMDTEGSIHKLSPEGYTQGSLSTMALLEGKVDPSYQPTVIKESTFPNPTDLRLMKTYRDPLLSPNKEALPDNVTIPDHVRVAPWGKSKGDYEAGLIQKRKGPLEIMNNALLSETKKRLHLAKLFRDKKHWETGISDIIAEKLSNINRLSYKDNEGRSTLGRMLDELREENDGESITNKGGGTKGMKNKKRKSKKKSKSKSKRKRKSKSKRKKKSKRKRKSKSKYE
tara:strand:+ start:552 stop:1793 length:1242 start_codon:yes stop_codon:yes gene_type:complete